ncbi:hypothetical protein A3C09_03605 [Candidatus Uhrbacteria bacterium RIFCSPHIGHO2_02_FULL_47_44]|uniref:Uncharacterized protein n=1 Tax=Candidatus Uhrbacteria bacterium RIFCSPLOWO2_02_FULL_48_18 TaxID=1802408 RepID=A0A1F7V775_9BACT|nr:MAG: hypothetical protein A2839_04760 [Candidatus Uhrbacteria bacterium RIFCSPHIGHO2_01_FULL_47_10]OGL71292.1 MAG: hypothetical protein A3C09_03605 [Candidatus Uhrbacteria bacterium RIFCSPHIGHO2_02_FULL_47_44]OGL76104.1 MAG: hypothetical protein A3E97_02440 [Candidatus Uhrbacteria bacterium RIFCSPHIGHO2_12_FULL_47_12]OGL80386.1 MAG: hypothetical protein A3B20_03145 [Candidatus Uhrbacteria bacterium RIFCSPLOWO2_01_FULL_47_17]OGL86245.1 MAG: hypothetical protein A3I41_01635 [Candidatus Uhrbact
MSHEQFVKKIAQQNLRLNEQHAGKTIVRLYVDDDANVVIEFLDHTELKIENTGGCCYRNSIKVDDMNFDWNESP